MRGTRERNQSPGDRNREIRALSHRYHVEDVSQHSSATMLRLHLFRYQAVRSPPVSVFSTLISTIMLGWSAHLLFALRVSRRVSLACVRGRGWATHGLLTEVSTGVPWVLTGTHPCDAPPRQGGGTSERQLVLCWSKCSGASHTVCGLCRQYVLYCVLSHPSSTWSRLWPCRSWEKLRTTRGSPLADTTVCWFHLTASAVLLIGSVSGSSGLCLNSFLALTVGLLFSFSDGYDCIRRAASSTSCNIQYTRLTDDKWFIWSSNSWSISSRSFNTTCASSTCLTSNREKVIFVIQASLEIRYASRHCTDSGQYDQSSSRTPSSWWDPCSMSSFLVHSILVLNNLLQLTWLHRSMMLRLSGLHDLMRPADSSSVLSELM